MQVRRPEQKVASVDGDSGRKGLRMRKGLEWRSTEDWQRMQD